MSDAEVEKFSMRDPRTQTSSDQDFATGMAVHFGQSLGSDLDKLRNFTKYVPRQVLSMFLAKHEIFKHVLDVHGHIIECGVFLGGGLLTWAQLSAIFEPVNHIRRIVGFDTFTGFPQVSSKDKADNEQFARPGGLATHAEEDLRETIRLFDMNRTIGHIPRVDLVVGDAMETIPRYIEQNAHLVVAMLYLDFDLYEPTKLALETFLPRMPKGAVICFDELGDAAWPGETLAALDTVGLRNLRIKRFPTTSQLAYAVLE